MKVSELLVLLTEQTSSVFDKTRKQDLINPYRGANIPIPYTNFAV